MNRIFIYGILILLLAGCARNPGVSALKRGMRALEKGRHTESISWFQRSLNNIAANKTDERAIALNCLGISYYKLGQAKNALKAFEDASAANPGAVEPIYNMGITCFETGDEDKAIACFEKAALLSEENTRALEFLAVIYSQRRQWGDAQRVLNEAAQHTRLSPRLLTALAVTEIKANNINQALELLQEALEQDAHYAPAIYDLAVINQRHLRKHDQALPLFTEYTRLVPTGPQADQARLIIAKMKDSRAPLSPTTTAVKTESAAPMSAVQTQQTAVAPSVIFPSFEELMQVAKKLEQQGRREAAFNNYLRLARVAEQTGKTSIRNQALKHAISLADGHPQAAYELGVYFAERNKKDEAFIYFKAAVSQNKNISSHPASMALAKLALEKSDFDTAIVSLKKADQIKPGDPEALWLLTELYDRHLSLSNSAASAYTQFVARFPNDRRTPAALNRLKTLNPDFKPSAEASSGKNVNSRSFWQRMFKSSIGRTNEEFNKQSGGAEGK
ncbi:MAG: tetratricopeptide repeat protein [Kiritimatiellia bacterium]|nr:tetratricopeptide repeat protein [Kiritimatiellia bacterium]